MNFSTIYTNRGIAATLVICLFAIGSLQAQNDPPALFEKLCNGDQINSTAIIAAIEINGEPAVAGQDYVAIFDSDGFIIGTGGVTAMAFSTSCSPETRGINFQVNGTNGAFTPDATCPTDYGANAGEVLTGLIFDGDTGFYYELPGNIIFNTAGPIFPSGSVCTPANGTVLPAVLTAFRGQVAGPKHIRLTWDVAREENVSHYEVQRSTNGRNWNVLDDVAAAGNSETALNYSFDDFSPEGLRQFYRLRMVDIDGADELSGIVITELDQTGERTVNTFPNPASLATRLSIQLGGKWNPNVPINASLYDLNGRVLADYNNLQVGTSSVAISSATKAGLYLLRVTQADAVFTHKISLQ